MAVMRMGHSKSIANNTGTASGSGMNPIFHDFLGMSCASDSPVVFAPKTVGHGGDARRSEASPSASASAGASSGGGRGPISTTSDLGSERQAGDHFDGVPFYGPKSDISGPEISNRLAGSKRSNSDSFMGSSRDGVPQIGPESLESSHLMKILRNGTGGDRPRRSSDEELFLGMQSLRPTSASLILQPPTGQFAPFLHQVPPNRFKDANSGNAGPSNLSQPAADEGSRTGIKGSGILSSITANASGSVSERNPSGLLPSGNRPKSRTHILEPESSTAPSRLGSTSSSRQMTIFYGGQAHVFDDVHPNKADVIMALAGSNGGSWSTTYSPKSTVKPVGESTPNGDNETGMAGNSMFPREFRGRLSLTGNPSQGYGSGDRILTLTGAPQGVNIPKDTRNPVKAAEPSTEEKRREV
ncbi:protein TIFY 8 isoform X2 [Vitis riparia]|uniref:protein TIFY 8 isoform X2 n=1 Tax=Vitis riparia TaxID=96939 RepID=UPI00155B1912|nr:protein TIFY 8 isoform X2 [Vitis riparia]